MSKIAYINKRFSTGSKIIIEAANEIIIEYANQGYSLTLRQLYYQFVSRDLIPNTQKEYKRLGSIINDARLAGLIDWLAITDRTRNLVRNSHWEDPAHIIDSCINSYQIDRWANQEFRPEVWIEKDALIGVIENVCQEHDIPYFSCRGYVSQSEMWQAAQRHVHHVDNGQKPIIFHLGDHDPSGIDMTRDIFDRIDLMAGWEGETPIQRLALNMDQVKTYNPPPNPTKLTDTRSSGYVKKHGQSSWELDALEPSVMVGMVEAAIMEFKDHDLWDEALEKEEQGRSQLEEVRDELNNE